MASLAISLAFLAMLGYLLPPAVIAWYGLASTVTFLAYAFDKTAARQGRGRLRERTLHVCSLAGGWPGAAIAQQLLRHKSRKQPFRTLFWITAAVNGAVPAALLLADRVAV